MRIREVSGLAGEQHEVTGSEAGNPGIGQVVHGPSLLTENDVYLFREGNHFRLYEKLGSHSMELDGAQGTLFAVWAPNARRVSVIGDFNGWNTDAHNLAMRSDGSGIWEGFIPGVRHGCLYKYHMVSDYGDYAADKGDPFALYWEISPRTASVVWDLHYDWADPGWMKGRHEHNRLAAPFSIYEVHLGSWRRNPEEGNRFLTYGELAEHLVDYVKEMGFTHVEFLPVTEHPFYGSWGYEPVGYYAPTSRFGTPQDFMRLIDRLHRNGVGVVLDWVVSHFPSDIHGLAYFDGTHLFEHMDPRQGFHPDWNSFIFNFGRNEVRSFLISNALFWLDRYHVDGLRADAVSSMLYLDFSRKEGEWIPNPYGGRENLEAMGFLRRMNEAVYGAAPDTQTIAEESTAWPMVTKPPYLGGLGFGMKWNMGWTHDTLNYFSLDHIYRKHHHDKLISGMAHAYSENFLLPLSHDEVVHDGNSLLKKMPGDDWQKLANLRLLAGYLYTHTGKKLIFMGTELGQWREWDHDRSLDWHLLDEEAHVGIQRWIKDLNRFYRGQPALYELDFEPAGFEWIDCTDYEKSVLSFLRKGKSDRDTLLVVCNFTPVLRRDYRIGLPSGGYWKEMLNSDGKDYGGSGQGNCGGLNADPVPFHGRSHSLSLTLPPLGLLVFKKAHADSESNDVISSAGQGDD
jgi:1,4-alpha-glucan branching enzyme